MTDRPAEEAPTSPALGRLLRALRLQDTSRVEQIAALWTGVAFFFVLFSYYLLRPVRETIGFAFGKEQLLTLYALTFAITSLLSPLQMAMAHRMPSSRFVPLSLTLFALSFLGLAYLFHGVPAELGKLGWGSWESPSWQGVSCGFFYSWVTAFAVCGVTLIWVHAVEWFSSVQGRRLFSIVAIGGTLGAIAGSATTGWLAGLKDVDWLAHDFHTFCMVLGAVGIEVGLLCWWMSLRACRQMRRSQPLPAVPRDTTSMRNGITLLVRSPYLLGIAGFVLISTFAATTFYYQQNDLARQLVDRKAQTEFNASVNFWQNTLSLLFQLFFTSRALLGFGLSTVLCVMPLVSCLGLLTLSFWPMIGVYGVIEVTRRMSQFAFDKPAREVLYTPLQLDEKYKVKAFIDTAVLRFGDLLAAGINALIVSAKVSASNLALYTAPVFAVWAVLGIWLGRHCRRREAAATAAQAGAVFR